MSDIDSDLCYKSCGNYIVTMKKLPDTVTNESRKDVVDPIHAAFRADKLLVVSIEDKITGKTIDRIQNTSYQNKKIWYEASKEVIEPDYYQDLDEVCAPGIHYFLSRESAFNWYNCNDGPHQNWHENGQKRNEYARVNGVLHGCYRSWYTNGQICEKCTYVNEVLDGLCQSWYSNGALWEESTYHDGALWDTYTYSDG